jgi:hypothetical protein
MRPGRADAGDVKSVALIDKALAKIGGVRAAA